MDQKRLLLPLLALTCVALTTVSCESDASPTATPFAKAAPSEQEALATSFILTSPAFAPGALIPAKYTCDGEDTSPPLEWQDPPGNTKTYALIVDDPDAPAATWVHWVLYNLPAENLNLPEDIGPDADLAAGGRHGNNSWKRLGYGGACPPDGTHRYFFKLYALDTVLDLEAGVNKEALLQAMEGHILAQTELMGTYSRQ